MKKIEYQDIVNLNREMTRLARQRGERHWGGGENNKKSIRSIVDTMHMGADNREPPERVCARAIRIFVRSPQLIYQPFGDCNHRTMTALTYQVLEKFYPDIKPNRDLWKNIRKKIDKWSEQEVERWITYAIIDRTSIQSGSLSNLRRDSSHSRLNSSSVIKSKYTSPDINSLWHSHGKNVSMEEIEEWKRRYPDWDVEARPSRITGRFDMFIKRR
jgi:hypothetical protein